MDGTDERRWVERLARFGLVAQGVSFGLVAVLALELALGNGGKATDRQGALQTLAHNGAGRLLVIALAVGFGAYALWRIYQAVKGRGAEGESEGAWKRISSLGKAAIYAVLCTAAVKALLGSSSGGNEEKKATGGVLDWPGGRWLIGIVGVAFLIAALWNFWRGVSGRFRKQLKTGEMSASELRWTTRIAVVGLVARAVVFALIGVFLIKAAAEFDPKEAIGLDGALRKLAAGPHGPWLLGLVAGGLFAFGLFCLIQARYREV